MTELRKHCFVIMPFSKTSEQHTEEYWTKHFDSFLKPLIEENTAFDAHRSEALRGDILRQIIKDLITSKVVVADLTDYNPNVFWELGVRQSFKNGTITIAEEGTRLPFDIIPKGTLFYNSKTHLNRDFCLQLKEALNSCLVNPDSPDSAVLESLSGRGTLYEIINISELLRRLQALKEECQWNISLIKRIINQIDENKKTPEKKLWVTHRFRNICLEVLLTQRYLQEDTAFYAAMNIAFMSATAGSEMLRNWYISDREERAESWFIKYSEIYAKRFNAQLSQIEKAEKNLVAKFPYIELT